MNSVLTYLNTFLFVVYPYICLTVFFMGSLARFDRDQYTWKSDSSQMLRTGTLRWGSNLFHIGILFLFFGHLFGQLTPHWMYEPFITAPQKQMLANPLQTCTSLLKGNSRKIVMPSTMCTLNGQATATSPLASGRKVAMLCR